MPSGLTSGLDPANAVGVLLWCLILAVAIVARPARHEEAGWPRGGAHDPDDEPR